MKWTPKIFICEIPKKIKINGDCCWLQGYITNVDTDEDGVIRSITIDDGTSSVRIFLNDNLKTKNLCEGLSGKSLGMYVELLEELFSKGRYISVICTLEANNLYILHVSDSINQNPNSEAEWLNSIIKARCNKKSRTNYLKIFQPE